MDSKSSSVRPQVMRVVVHVRKREGTHLLHRPDDIYVAVKDDRHGHEEAEYKQVDYIGRRIQIMGIPIY